MIGEHVLFQGKIYIIKFIYTSGMCELEELNNPWLYELVPKSEIKKVFA